MDAKQPKLDLLKKKLQTRRRCKGDIEQKETGCSAGKAFAGHGKLQFLESTAQVSHTSQGSTTPRISEQPVDLARCDFHCDDATASDIELVISEITVRPRPRATDQLQSVGSRALSGLRLRIVLDYLTVDALPCFWLVSLGFHYVLHDHLESNATLSEKFYQALTRKVSNPVWVGLRLKPGQCESLNVSGNTIVCKAEAGRTANFTFHHVFDGAATQVDVWSSVSSRVERGVRSRLNTCLMAYGQTGSGKTHTMFGELACSEGEGIAFRTLRSTASILRDKAAKDKDFKSSLSIEFSFLEVYNENVYDLLDEHSHIHFTTGLLGVTRLCCDLDQMEEQVHKWICKGAATRTVGKTAFNPHSSRSHAVATIYINWSKSYTSCIYLVDLAGSERAGQYALCDAQLREGCNINQGLSALGRVVGAMARGKGEHVPFRDSVLTWLLKDVITGNQGIAIMFANVSPESPAETLSTIRYAQQYSTLKSGASTELSALGTEVRVLQVQVDMRRRQLEEGAVLHREKLMGELQQLHTLLQKKQSKLRDAQKEVAKYQRHEHIEYLSQPKVRDLQVPQLAKQPNPLGPQPISARANLPKRDALAPSRVRQSCSSSRGFQWW